MAFPPSCALVLFPPRRCVTVAAVPVSRRCRGLRRLLFQVLLPLAARGEAVHHGAVSERALRCGNILALAGPRLLRRRLQGTAIAEREPPRQAADPVHGVEVRGRLLVRLPAGEE